MSDPTAFRSGVLPTSHFDKRFSDENLSFWVPRLVAAAQIAAGNEVLDVGCGTGGFSREIAARTSAAVTGCDEAEHFIAFARAAAAPSGGTVGWVVANAEELPFAPSSFDRVLLSLVLHQVADPLTAVREAFRVLRAGGVALVRSIAPDDARERVPERYLPSIAAADAARMPAIETIREWLRAAGFERIAVERHLRNKVIDVDEEETALRAEIRGRYAFVSAAELEGGLRRMREARDRMASPWVDPRPTYIITTVKPG
jgi:SAM-dependent methyltransferase